MSTVADVVSLYIVIIEDIIYGRCYCLLLSMADVIAVWQME